mmetsp:Transcript_72516/g.132820  ORF Transcript_72516/g.132820 Transcript_72516/m.132820 type:complete len:173 (+) Transcript_72516:536-1054(+)
MATLSGKWMRNTIKCCCLLAPAMTGDGFSQRSQRCHPSVPEHRRVQHQAPRRQKDRASQASGGQPVKATTTAVASVDVSAVRIQATALTNRSSRTHHLQRCLCKPYSLARIQLHQSFPRGGCARVNLLPHALVQAVWKCEYGNIYLFPHTPISTLVAGKESVNKVNSCDVAR